MSEIDLSKHHISQLFNLPTNADLDFFDANLAYDTPVFIDPFLLKKSFRKTETELFERFGDFFRYAYDKSADLSIGEENIKRFGKLLTFPEPENIYMGYTQASNKGRGPTLTAKLLEFFLENSAKKFVKETDYFPDRLYNPVSLQVFTDGVGPDGISDITANLIMDYLITYTIEQSEKWGIQRKKLPLDHDGFDFSENEWRGGGWYELPENPLKTGEPIVFVPKHFLRGLEEVTNTDASKVFSILKEDADLSEKFSDLLEKVISDVTHRDIRKVFLEEGKVHRQFLKLLEEERSTPYDFKLDFLSLMSDKDYKIQFEDADLGQVDSCESLKGKTEHVIDIFREELVISDGWKDAWRNRTKSSIGSPQTEPVIGRKFRGMANAYFSHFPDVTFIPEAGIGGGFIDFYIAYKDCKIVIELKLLNNSSRKGLKPKIPAYIHGLTRQLPLYAQKMRAKHAYYITGQHYDGTQGTKTNHNDRLAEVVSFIPETEANMKTALRGFESLTHINIKMSPHPTPSEV